MTLTVRLQELATYGRYLLAVVRVYCQPNPQTSSLWWVQSTGKILVTSDVKSQNCNMTSFARMKHLGISPGEHKNQIIFESSSLMLCFWTHYLDTGCKQNLRGVKTLINIVSGEQEIFAVI